MNKDKKHTTKTQTLSLNHRLQDLCLKSGSRGRRDEIEWTIDPTTAFHLQTLLTHQRPLKAYQKNNKMALLTYQMLHLPQLPFLHFQTVLIHCHQNGMDSAHVPSSVAVEFPLPGWCPGYPVPQHMQQCQHH